MKQFDLTEARLQLAELIDLAIAGELVLIARDGQPLVQVVAVDVLPQAVRRLGFLEGRLSVPDDFDRMDEAEIARLFGVVE